MNYKSFNKEIINHFELQDLKLDEKLGIKKSNEVDNWYDYFINEFLPTKKEYMLSHIQMNFHPLLTVIKIALDNNLLNHHKKKEEIEIFLERLKR
jgi:hypothetical protein